MFLLCATHTDRRWRRPAPGTLAGRTLRFAKYAAHNGESAFLHLELRLIGPVVCLSVLRVASNVDVAQWARRYSAWRYSKGLI